MGSFSDSFKTNITGRFKDLMVNNLAGCSSTVLGAILRLRDSLSSRVGAVDSLICALTSDAELIHDVFAESGQILISNAEYIVEVDSSIAGAIETGLLEAIHNGKETLATGLANVGLTVSDAAGHIYNFVDARGLIVDGVSAIISTSDAPQTISDLLLYRENGVIKLNNLIRTADFVPLNFIPVPVPQYYANLLDGIQWISYMARGAYGTTISECLNNIKPGDDSIFAKLSTLCQELHLRNISDISDGVLTLYNYYRSNYLPSTTPTGYVNSIWNVVNDLIESSALNSAMLDVCQAICSTNDRVSAIQAVAAQLYAHKFNCVKKFATGLSTALNRGGLYGASMYILNYLKAIGTDLIDDDGTMRFTDNASLIPAQYIAGMISQIVSSVGSMVSMIGAMISPIIGAAIYLVTSVASGIIKAIEYDYESTNAAINTSDRVYFDSTPFGVLQATVPISNLPSSELLDLVQQGESFTYISIPGGFLLVGPGAFNDKGDIVSLNIELHPSATDIDRSAITTLASWLYSRSAYDWRLYGGYTYAELSINMVGTPYETDYIANLYSNSLTGKTITNNPDNDRLTNDDDRLMRENVMCNLTFALTYLISLVPSLGSSEGLKGHFSVDNVNRLYIDANDVDYSGGPWSALLLFGPYQSWVVTPITLIEDPDHVGVIQHWSEIATTMNNLTDGDRRILWTVLSSRSYFGSVIPLPTDIEHCLYVPRYDKRTFAAWLVTTILVTAVVAAVTVVTVFKVRRAIQQKRAINQANVEKAWSDLSKNPTAENYKAYRTAVKKNNRWSRLIGGTRYDYVNYWNGDVGSDQAAGSSAGSVLNSLNVGNPSVAQEDSSSDANQLTDNFGFEDLVLLIRGPQS